MIDKARSQAVIDIDSPEFELLPNLDDVERALQKLREMPATHVVAQTNLAGRRVSDWLRPYVLAHIMARLDPRSEENIALQLQLRGLYGPYWWEAYDWCMGRARKTTFPFDHWVHVMQVRGIDPRTLPLSKEGWRERGRMLVELRARLEHCLKMAGGMP